MTHLNRTEFVDLIESSALPAERVRHLESCDRCRTEAEALRNARLTALENGGPEPSPLFWTHFAARVSEAVRNEPAPVAPARWLRTPMTTWATAATVAALVVATTVWRTTLHAPSPMPPISQQAAAPATVPAASPATADGVVPDDVDTDEAWAVVRAAAIDLNWDDVRAAGISAHPGDVERVAQELSADERVELARLLDEDRKRNGA